MDERTGPTAEQKGKGREVPAGKEGNALEEEILEGDQYLQKYVQVRSSVTKTSKLMLLLSSALSTVLTTSVRPRST